MQTTHNLVRAIRFDAEAAHKMRMLSRCTLFALSALIFAASDAFGAGPSSAARTGGATAGSACGEANQDRGSCLREEAAARAEMKQGKRDSSGDSGAFYQQNALARCGALPAADRADCERRVRGEGTTSGNVSGGGIYRELVTPVPAEGNPATAPAKQ
jgi:hypothetical protein